MFHIHLRGEDGTEFTIEADVASVEAAFDYAEDLYPEAIALDVFEPSVRAQEIYERVCRRMDDEDVYHEGDD